MKFHTLSNIKARFNIRKGVEFHNGKTLTPEDVVASINHHRGEESTSGAKGLLEALEEMSVDGNSVIFKLKAANADWPVSICCF